VHVPEVKEPQSTRAMPAASGPLRAPQRPRTAKPRHVRDPVGRARMFRRKTDGGNKENSTTANTSTQWVGGLREKSGRGTRLARRSQSMPVSSGTSTQQPAEPPADADASAHPEAGAPNADAVPAVQLSKEELLAHRTAARLVESRIRSLWAFRTWHKRTVEARFVGPCAVPSGNQASVKALVALQHTPQGAVAAFLLACMRRHTNRKASTDLVMLTLHPDLLIEDKDGAGTTIRKHVFKKLHGLTKTVLGSLVVGTVRDDNYAFGCNVRFEFDMTNGTISTGRHVSHAMGTLRKVCIVAPASKPARRTVQVKRWGGRWVINHFDELSSMHVPRFVAAEDSGATDGAAAIAAAAGPESDPPSRITSTTVTDRGHVPGMLRVFNSANQVTGYIPAINFEKIKRKRIRARQESPESKHQRHLRARNDTTVQATKLAHKDLCKRWAQQPQVQRRIVSGTGLVENLPPLRSHHVQALLSGAPLGPGQFAGAIGGVATVPKLSFTA